MDAATVEQMNKLRKTLGLPLLSTPSEASGPTSGLAFKEHRSPSGSEDDTPSTLETREAAGYANYQNLQNEEKKRQERERRKLEIQRARDKAQRYMKLEGKGLGEIDDDGDLDTRAWLKSSKKREKKIAQERLKRMEEELAERDRLANVRYTADDLANLRVAHEIGDFDAADAQQILTLKDTKVDEDASDDELEDLDLVARDTLAKKLELKKKRPAYDPNATDEHGQHSILSQYDEEIYGEKKRKLVKLSGLGVTPEEREAKRQLIGEKLKAQPISLDVPKPELQGDYLDVPQVKIKKPKKSKNKSARKRLDDGEDIFPADGQDDSAMAIDGESQTQNPKSTDYNSSFVDDEDLQFRLAAQRKANFKRHKRQAADIIKQIQEDEAETSQTDDAEAGLVLDETSEFISNLQVNRPEAKPDSSVRPSVEEPQSLPSPADDDGDVPMDEANDGIDDGEHGPGHVKREQSVPGLTATGLENEADLDQGIGATLKLLRERGIVRETSTGDLAAIQRQREIFLRDKKLRENEAERRARMQREADRQSGKLQGMSVKEREELARWQNVQRSEIEARRMAEVFNKEFVPSFELTYTDELGRRLNQKEAFKHLSHQFHGKGSGKQKTEKRLKKIDEEKKRTAASILDSSQAVGLDKASGTQARKNKQAGVRLA